MTDRGISYYQPDPEPLSFQEWYDKHHDALDEAAKANLEQKYGFYLHACAVAEDEQ